MRFTPLAGALRIDVEYTDENGVLFQKPFVVDEAQEPELRAAGKISMVHDSREPRRAEVGHVVSVSNTFLAETAVLAAGLLVMLAGFCYVAKCARQVIQTDRLFRYGQIVETEVRDAAMAPGKETGRFTYAFRGSNGRWFEGKSPELPSAKLKAWPVGRTVLAVYDPMDPRRTEADIFGVLAGRRRDLPQTA
ncbi:MAG: hypothetical protein HYX27_12600 [Acidobacteria bacterium]|nr:hypothetical protein [Acidobacteriota bacterium]